MKQAELDKFIEYINRFCKEKNQWYIVNQENRPDPYLTTVIVKCKIDKE